MNKSITIPIRRAFLLLLMIAVLEARAATYTLPPGRVDLLGTSTETVAGYQDTLSDIARKYDIGYDEIVAANPGVAPWGPGSGTRITIPDRHILPLAPREGIVVNIAEMRLYYFFKPYPTGAQRVITYPVSVGRMDWATPLGTTKVVTKQENPVWRPPESIRKEHAQNGDILPEVVPAGPNNPLGAYALRLGVPGYLIHGTDKPYGIGMQVTHGCMRLYPEDIQSLFQITPVNTAVHLVYQPVKVGWAYDVLYLEVHPPLEFGPALKEDPLTTANRLISIATNDHIPADLDWDAVNKAVKEARGLPVIIWQKKTLSVDSNLPAPPKEEGAEAPSSIDPHG